jgi:hypothetical protein
LLEEHFSKVSWRCLSLAASRFLLLLFILLLLFLFSLSLRLGLFFLGRLNWLSWLLGKISSSRFVVVLCAGRGGGLLDHN